MDQDNQDLQLRQRIKEDPEWFFTEVLGIQHWEKQREIIRSVKDHQRTVVRSGNSSGKTFTIAGIALWFLHAFPPAIVIDTAPTHRQVENQFWRELRRAHNGAKMPLGGKLNKTQLHIDENWYAIGFSPKRGEGGMESMQGWHGENVLIIVDEGSGVHPDIFEAIEGALAGGAMVRYVVIGNPNRATGDFADMFKDPDFNKIHISAFDIPNVIEGRIVISGLATKEWVERMGRKYGKDDDIYRVRVLGEFPKKDSDAVIPLDLVEGAIDADRELYGEEEIIGLDPSRSIGGDPFAFVHRKGNKAKVLETANARDLMEIAGRAKLHLKAFPKAKLHIDIIGLGSGIFDRLREQPDIAHRVFGINVAMPANDTDTYVNLRAEGWYDTKAWLRDAVVEKHEGWYELAQPRFKINSRGLRAIESKEDMAKRGISSPNIADALVLTLQRPTEGGDAVFMRL